MSLARGPTERSLLTGTKANPQVVNALLAAHERFPALFRDSTRAMVLFSAGARLVDANRALTDLLGRTPSELRDRAYLSWLEREQSDGLARAFRRAKNGETLDFNFELTHAAGHRLSLRVELTPARIGTSIVGVYATLTDLTALRRFDAKGRARSIQELDSLFRNHTDAIVSLDGDGRIADANDAALGLLGCARAAVRGRELPSLAPSDARGTWSEFLGRALQGATSSPRLALGTDGRERTEVACSTIPIVVDGRITGAYAILRDAGGTARERAARDQAERTRELFLIAASDARGAGEQIAAALELGREQLGCEAAYVARIERGELTVRFGAGRAAGTDGGTLALDRSVHRFVVEAGHAIAIDDLSAARPPDPTRLPVYGFAGAPLVVGGMKYGTVAFLSTRRRTSKFTAFDREFARLIGILVASALERAAREQHLGSLAFSDALTGLPNRQLLSDRLTQAIAAAQRHEMLFAVHFYDLDGFKSINDRHGHARGDDVLRVVAHRMERAARQEDTVARIGGDEFVVLQPNVRGAEDAQRLAERIREAVSEPFFIEGHDHRITASGGIALYPAHGRDPETLLAGADAALYRVKSRGRNALELARPPDEAL
jgi:diguanylate cyclase (GGDEF)-like protein/PAS domain S-box-containing protein